MKQLSETNLEEEKVDSLDIWREEISKEFRKWLEKYDDNNEIAKLLCSMEKRSPQDFFDEEPYNQGPRPLLNKFKEMGLAHQFFPVTEFYRAFHGPTYEKCMLNIAYSLYV